MGHLEDPSLTSDLTVARDFDLGMTGPPLSISMDFIAGGLVEMIGGLASAVVLVRLRVVGADRARAARGWRRTGCCARARSGATATPTRCARAQRDADYAYRLAVDPPASKELRLFGLAGWTIDRFVARRTRLHELQYEATRLREQPLLVEPADRRSPRTSSCSGRWPRRPPPGASSLGEVVVYAQCAVGDVDDRVRRAQLGARRRGGAGGRGAAARSRRWRAAGALAVGRALAQPACPRARSASAT